MLPARISEPKILKLPYRGAPQTVETILRGVMDSTNDYKTRLLCEQICSGLRSKDWTSEALALYRFVEASTRYMRDPRTIELVKAPYLIVAEILAGHTPNIDCLPADTLLLGEDLRFHTIQDVTPGSRIWGYNRWSTVGNVWYKGLRSIDAVTLNNGSTFFATTDHKIYVARCQHFSIDSERYRTCSCRVTEREIVRIPLRELCVRDVVLTPKRLPFGSEHQDPDRALIEGLYLSDGWVQKSSFYISGQDGCPKEAQKRWVQQICARLEIPIWWGRKAIGVHDKEWAHRIHLMGHCAPEKHALSVNLDEGAAGALLRGIMADSTINTGGYGQTLTTTSRELFLQARILHKMFGLHCSEHYLVNHGGLGKNPIWRLGVRSKRHEDGDPAKLLRVKSIARAVMERPVYDLSTDDHFVYLPEADVVVSNCDEMAALLLTFFTLTGAECRAVIVAFRHAFCGGERQYSHVFAQVREPKSGVWITCDPVAGPDTKNMLKRVVAAKIYPVA